jgi:Ca-activated chloride channel family protein
MTSDDDDLDALRQAMTQATPHPDPATRAAHLRLAQENFDALQGSRAQPRSMSDSSKGGVWQGVTKMFQSLTSRGALTMTTAIVACGFLILTPAGQNLLRGDLRSEADVPPVNVPPVETPAEPAADTVANMDAETGAPAPEPLRNEVAQTEVPKSEPPVSAAIAEPVGTLDTAEIAEAEAGPMPMARQTAPATAAPMDDGFAATAPAAPVMVAPLAAAEPAPTPLPDTEEFANADENPLRITAESPVSTFSIDVDTASWSIVRQSLNAGRLPPPDAVRVEEMINYFPYDYPAPQAGEAPFRPTVTVFDTPWNPDTDLVHIAIQGMMPAIEDRPPLNLVFLIDTSGSMEDPTKLPLLKQSFRLMLDNLRPEDQVAIVTYAGSAGLVLEPTPASDRNIILKALNDLSAGGSTNGQGGLEQAYATAAAMMQEGEVARILLATDGDFNVGIYDPSELTSYIEDKRDTGIYLSVLGFGRSNLDDATMQALAQNGNGIAAYIDTLNEAQKVLVDQLTGALFPIAGDVKVQVEFNPATVAEYRLIGYVTRALNREDFNNDRVDAGDLGAGHSVTAIYEITPVGSPAQLSDPLRYSAEASTTGPDDELGFLRLRWKNPGEDTSDLMETPIPVGSVQPGTEARFAAAIAGMGQLLRGSAWTGDWGWDEAIALAQGARGEDPFGYRNEAVQLMRLAQSLSQ